MELRHLRYFVALAESLHFGRAADRMHVTQSTLSHQIKQLEDELGYRLFQRTSGGVSMTVEGSLWLDFVSKALGTIDEGVRSLRRSPVPLTGEIRVAAGQAFCAWLMPVCLGSFLEKQPRIKVVIEQVVGSYLIDRLATGDIDLGVGYQPHGVHGVVFDPIYDEEMKLAIPERHRFARRRRISMIELHGQRMALLSNRFSTRQMLNECFAGAGAEPMVVVEANSYATLLALVPALNLMTIMPERPHIDMSGIAVVALENPTPVRTFGLIWKRGREKCLATQTFAAVVRQAIQDAGVRCPPREKQRTGQG